MSTRSKYFILIPPAAWLSIFFVMPVMIILLYSFYERGTYGELVPAIVFDSYMRILDPIYLGIFWRSFYIALISTVICLFMGYPLAWFIAKQSNNWKKILLMLLIVPFWTNFLVRTYAWIFILRTEGLLNSVLLGTGIIGSPLNILFTETAVVIGLVYTYLPFMVLPIYVSIEKLDRTFLDASRDLGASPIQTFRKIILPLTKAGYISGCILVFVPCLGAYITPDLLGGAKSMMVGNLIQIQFLSARDWPFGSAISFVVMGIVLGLLFFYVKMNSSDYDHERREN